MTFIERNDLAKYLNKTELLEGMLSGNKVALILAKKGKDITENEYRGRNVDVKSLASDNSVYITASAPGLMFREYGTGVIGQSQPYKGKLPSTGVPLTGHWEYYYPSKYKATVNGKKGWWTGTKHRAFLQGQYAGNDMYDAEQKLIQYINTDFAKDLVRL